MQIWSGPAQGSMLTFQLPDPQLAVVRPTAQSTQVQLVPLQPQASASVGATSGQQLEAPPLRAPARS